MSLSKMTTDVENIKKLSDTPNSTDGISSNMLKDQFDKAGKDIKNYLNETLTKEIDETFATKEEVIGITAGTILDNTISEEKLSNSLQSKIDAILDVDNNITKALLYPDLISNDVLAELSQQQNYKDSQISKLLNIVNDLSSQVATLRYDSIISGNNSKGSVKAVNKSFSTAPKLVSRTGTITQSIWNNTIRVQCINGQYGDVTYTFGQEGIWVDKLHLKPLHLTNYQTTDGILKIYYTTDGSEIPELNKTWTQITSANLESYYDEYTSVASSYNAESGAWRVGYSNSYSYPQTSYYASGTDMSWTLSLGEMKFIKGLKIELTQTGTVSNTTEFAITPVLSLANAENCFNNKIHNAIVSKSGVFTGATGSTAVDDSGKIVFTNIIPKNSFLTFKIGSTAHGYYYSTGTNYLNTSSAKRMYIQGSNDGTNWEYLCYFSGRVFNYNGTYSASRGFGGVEGTYCQNMNSSNFFITVPGGFKQYRFYCPQESGTVIPPAMTARQQINSYIDWENYNSVNATIYNNKNFLPMTDIILDGYSLAIGAPIEIQSELAKSDTAISEAFFIVNRSIGIDEEVSVKVGTINASNTDIEGDTTVISKTDATVTNNGDTVVISTTAQEVANTGNGKDIKFIYKDKNASLGTQTITSLVGGYL